MADSIGKNELRNYLDSVSAISMTETENERISREIAQSSGQKIVKRKEGRNSNTNRTTILQSVRREPMYVRACVSVSVCFSSVDSCDSGQADSASSSSTGYGVLSSSSSAVSLQISPTEMMEAKSFLHRPSTQRFTDFHHNNNPFFVRMLHMYVPYQLQAVHFVQGTVCCPHWSTMN